MLWTKEGIVITVYKKYPVLSKEKLQAVVLYGPHIRELMKGPVVQDSIKNVEANS